MDKSRMPYKNDADRMPEALMVPSRQIDSTMGRVQVRSMTTILTLTETSLEYLLGDMLPYLRCAYTSGPTDTHHTVDKSKRERRRTFHFRIL
jgi:hypothetical protein